jgi:hypothetical protein
MDHYRNPRKQESSKTPNYKLADVPLLPRGSIQVLGIWTLLLISLRAVDSYLSLTTWNLTYEQLGIGERVLFDFGNVIQFVFVPIFASFFFGWLISALPSKVLETLFQKIRFSGVLSYGVLVAVIIFMWLKFHSYVGAVTGIDRNGVAAFLRSIFFTFPVIIFFWRHIHLKALRGPYKPPPRRRRDHRRASNLPLITQSEASDV